MKVLIPAAAALAIPATPAFAQYDPIWLGQGAVAQSTMNNARANTRNAARSGYENSPEVSQACSADSVPIAEQERISDEYMWRAEVDGKESADIWVREEGVRYRMELVRQGICPEPTAHEMAALAEWRARTRDRR